MCCLWVIKEELGEVCPTSQVSTQRYFSSNLALTYSSSPSTSRKGSPKQVKPESHHVTYPQPPLPFPTHLQCLIRLILACLKIGTERQSVPRRRSICTDCAHGKHVLFRFSFWHPCSHVAFTVPGINMEQLFMREGAVWHRHERQILKCLSFTTVGK